MGREFAARVLADDDKRFGQDKLAIVDCRIERVQYKPRKNCLICYRLGIRDQRTGKNHEQRLCARIFEAGGALSRYRKAAGGEVTPPQFGPPLMHIESLDMVVWAFPNERKLRGLDALTDVPRLREDILPGIVRAAWGADWTIQSVAPSLAHYVPEHTCSVRVDLRLANNVTGEVRPWIIFGKTYHEGQGEDAFRLMGELWNSRVRQEGALNIPRPLAYLPQHQQLWQEGLHGRTLMECAPDGAEDGLLIDSAAAAIAGLHRTPVDMARHTHMEDLLARLGQRQALLAMALPELEHRLVHLTDRLTGHMPGATNSVTLHGDLHPQNIFIGAAGVSLIDLDSLTQGPCEADLGSWIAGALYRAVLCGEPLRSVAPSLQRFISSYRDHAPWQVSDAALDWYTAAALIHERAFRCLTRLKAGRLDIVDRLVDLADHVSAGGALWRTA